MELGGRGYDIPVLLNGSPGKIWGAYAFNDNISVANRLMFIANHGIDKNGIPNQLGTKSMTLGGSGSGSPNSFKTYFGNGSSDSGYNEIYMFYRVKIQKTAFPTRIIDIYNKIVGYDSSEQYFSLNSWKFINVGSGFMGVNSPCTDSWCHNTYSDSENWYALNQFHSNYAFPPTIKMIVDYIASIKPPYSKINYFATPNSMIYDEWIGIEIHHKLENPAGAYNGIAEMIIYDKNGNPLTILQNNSVNFRPAGADTHKINSVYLDGNKRIQVKDNSYDLNNNLINCGAPGISCDLYYICDSTMDCNYYIDDFIINDKPIGQTYFQLLNQQIS